MVVRQSHIFETFEIREQWRNDNCERCHWQGRCDAQRELFDEDHNIYHSTIISTDVLRLTGLDLANGKCLDPVDPCHAFLSAEYEAWRNRMLEEGASS